MYKLTVFLITFSLLFIVNTCMAKTGTITTMLSDVIIEFDETCNNSADLAYSDDDEDYEDTLYSDDEPQYDEEEDNEYYSDEDTSGYEEEEQDYYEDDSEDY